MNCVSCGGPVSETLGRSRMLCSYCGTINLPRVERVSIDRVETLGQPGKHGCPSCGLQLSLAFVEDALVECCSSCAGVLFERDVFTSVVWERRGTFQGSEEQQRPVDPAELQERRTCPRCQQAMDCHPYYGPGNAVVDSCHRCDLVWLDAGELTTLERAPGLRQLRT